MYITDEKKCVLGTKFSSDTLKVSLKRNSWGDCLEGIIGNYLWFDWRLEL